MSKGKWVWVALPRGSWDLWWVPLGTWTANPHFLTVLWQAQTSAKEE